MEEPNKQNMFVEFFNKNKKGAIEFLRFAIIALLIVIPIRYFIAQPFIVSGDSMYPTFHDGQYLIIDELSYYLGTPHRGDVIVFHYPVQHSKYLIKRIIGLPNETIEIKNGKITVGSTCPDTAICADDRITLNEPYIDEPFNITRTYTTKDNEYFVMGDNRNRSSDSRAWGVLPKSDIVGRVYLRLLPVNYISYLPGKANY